MKSRLENIYKEKIVGALKKELNVSNVHMIPKLEKVVINTGVKEAIQDQKKLDAIMNIITLLAGQKAVKTKAHKSIAGFKIRQGMGLGVRVTLRNNRMYEFMDKLLNIALPCVRDFRGLKSTFDGKGNYNLGIKDWMIFPEVDFDKVDGSRGLNISIITSAQNDDAAKALLKHFGMLFM